MRKIPTVFERDFAVDGHPVQDKVNPDAAWVMQDEGIATVKIDGTCCAVILGSLWKRHEVKLHKTAPREFVSASTDGPDPFTGAVDGWIPVTNGPEDRWHREALEEGMADGTYELVGPKVQGNPYQITRHVLVPHGDIKFHPSHTVLLTWHHIRSWLEMYPVEGIVWHHPDGRMAKIKRRDFGIPWPVPTTLEEQYRIEEPYSGWPGVS